MRALTWIGSTSGPPPAESQKRSSRLLFFKSAIPRQINEAAVVLVDALKILEDFSSRDFCDMNVESKSAVELCALLVSETYGDLTSRLFTVLLRRGRLPIPTLRKHTQLSLQHIRHGLAVLIQQDLVYHHLDPDSNVTYYEANHNAAYKLVRSGKICEIVEERFGKAAKDIVVNLFQLGHTRVSELVAAYKKLESKTVNGDDEGEQRVNGNGIAESHDVAISTTQLHGVLIKLLEAGLLEPVDARMFRSPADTYQVFEREALRDFRDGVKGAKGKEELANKVRDRMHDLRDETSIWQVKNGAKRALNGDGYANGVIKKRKLANGYTNGDHEYGGSHDGPTLDLDLTVRVNYEKCSVALRNQRLVELAKIRLGETSALVYEQFLLTLEPRIPRCRPDPYCDKIEEDMIDGPTVSTNQLLGRLSSDLDLGSGIGKVNSMRNGLGAKTNGRAAVKKQDSDDEDAIRPSKRQKVTFEDEMQEQEESQSRTVLLKNHLQVLANDSCGFLRKVSGDGQGEWSVDYESLSRHLRESELDKMILENYGQSGHRLVRMMRKVGKLEEKMIPNLGMMKQSEIRTKLAEMHMAGIVDIQEVARDAQHTIARTIFLWYFDEERVRSIYLNRLYKCMTRCFQRLEVENRGAKDVLTILQRQDVRGRDPEEFLEPDSLNKLQTFEYSEDSLLTQIGRLDDLISVFQDY